MSESSDPTAYHRAQKRRFEDCLDVVVRIRRLQAEHPTADNTTRLRQLHAERQALLRINRLEEARHAAEYRARIQQLEAERPEGWEDQKTEVDLPKMAVAALKVAHAMKAMYEMASGE